MSMWRRRSRPKRAPSSMELQTTLAKAERDLEFTLGARAGRRHLLQPHGQYRRFHRRRPAARQCGAARRRLHRRQFQGNAAQADQARPAGDDLGRCLRPRKFAGIVESISPAAGSVFTLLPPDNATGNFTKIVQRLPVRVRVPKDVARQNLLRAGMSVYATVDTTEGAADADSDADLDAPAMVHPQMKASAHPAGRVESWLRIVLQTRTRHAAHEPTPPPLRTPRWRAAAGARRADRAAAAGGVSDHGVRDVHVDPGHPGRLGVAHRHPGRPVGKLDRNLVGADRLSDRRGDRDTACRAFCRARSARGCCLRFRRPASPSRVFCAALPHRSSR